MESKAEQSRAEQRVELKSENHKFNNIECECTSQWNGGRKANVQQ